MEIGATVELSSGGQLMTVESIQGDEVHCVWMGRGDVKRAKFGKNLLRMGPPVVEIVLPKCPECKRLGPPPFPWEIEAKAKAKEVTQ